MPGEATTSSTERQAKREVERQEASRRCQAVQPLGLLPDGKADTWQAWTDARDGDLSPWRAGRPGKDDERLGRELERDWA